VKKNVDPIKSFDKGAGDSSKHSVVVHYRSSQLNGCKEAPFIKLCLQKHFERWWYAII
jgi:hypothetical protein